MSFEGILIDAQTFRNSALSLIRSLAQQRSDLFERWKGFSGSPPFLPMFAKCLHALLHQNDSPPAIVFDIGRRVVDKTGLIERGIVGIVEVMILSMVTLCGNGLTIVVHKESLDFREQEGTKLDPTGKRSVELSSIHEVEEKPLAKILGICMTVSP